MPSRWSLFSISNALVLAALGGCASSSSSLHATPTTSQLTIDRTYPYEVSYEILGVATAKACGGAKKSTGVAFGGATAAPGTVGNPDVYEKAKYLAIESIPEADNIMFVRAKVEKDDLQECITVTGRAYRILSLHAHSAAVTPEPSPPTPPAPVTPPAEDQR